MSNQRARAEREARLRGQLAELAQLQMQVAFLAQQLRHYEVLIMGAAEAIGKLLATVDGVLDQLEKNPKAVKDATFRAFLIHLKQEREKLVGQETQLKEVALDPPIHGGRIPGAPVAPTPEQARDPGRVPSDEGGAPSGAGDPPREE